MAVPLLSLSPLQDRGHHSWVQGRTRFHAIGAITADPGMLVVLGGLNQVWGATERTRAPLLALQQGSPRQWVPLQARGWRLLGTPPLSGGAGGPAGIPQSGRAAQRTSNLSLWVLPRRVPVALGCHPSRGWRYPPQPRQTHRHPRALHARRGLSARGRRSSAEVSPWRREEPGPSMEKYERIRVVGRGAFG